jgi:D-3-phosphoglycerate dehydrogenase
MGRRIFHIILFPYRRFSVKKVLISMPWSTNIVEDYDSFVAEMAKNGLEVILDRSERRLSEDELINYYPGIYAHVCGCDSVTDRVLAAGDRLKIISRIGIGYDTIDVEAATKRGIVVATTPGSGAEAVAEYAFAMMLAQARRVVQSNTIVRKGEWHREAGLHFFRKTVGIIGFGNIGRTLARISLRAFDMKILAFDSYQDEEYAKTNNITYCALDKLVREADFISVHIPRPIVRAT